MSQAKSAPRETTYLRPGAAWYLVLVLMIIYVISFIDRQIVSLLVGPIKTALDISDFKMGFLMGPGFALFYTFFGVPLGTLADRYNRLGIIAVGLILWSVTTAGCGLANQFSSLLLLRFGVAIGEATLSPAAYSMIADAFPPRRLATAISVYSMGIYIGSGMAMLFGGYIVYYATKGGAMPLPMVGQLSPWQLVFVAVGLPGLPLALLLLTVREPARHKSATQVTAKETMAYISLHKAAFLLHSIGFGLIALVGYANMAWTVTFFARVHKWEVQHAAYWYGVSILTGGSLGILLGGQLADALRARKFSDGSMRACILSAVLTIPFMLLYPLQSNGNLSMALVACLTFTTSLASGAAPTVIQQMIPPAMRGQASALYLFLVNIVAMGLGPLAVGFFNTWVFGDNGVAYSLIVVCVTACVGAAVLIGLGLKPFRHAAAEVDAIAQRAAGI